MRSRMADGMPEWTWGNLMSKKMQQTFDYNPPSREERYICTYAEAPYSTGLSPGRNGPVRCQDGSILVKACACGAGGGI